MEKNQLVAIGAFALENQVCCNPLLKFFRSFFPISKMERTRGAVSAAHVSRDGASCLAVAVGLFVLASLQV